MRRCFTYLFLLVFPALSMAQSATQLAAFDQYVQKVLPIGMCQGWLLLW